MSRDTGRLVSFGAALTYGAYGEMWAGRLGEAAAMFAGASDAYAAAGEHDLPQMDLDLLALRGHDDDVRANAQFAIQIGETMGIGAYADAARSALLTLDLGRANYEDGFVHALALFQADSIQVVPQLLPDLVEVAVRTDHTAEAESALQRLSERASAAATDWASGLLARSQALLARDGEGLYEQALELLSSAGMTIERGRTHLLYGESLRRQNRRIDARVQLRIAHELFAEIGAEPFAERARAELLVTGEKARKRTVETSTELTPQEAHVARLAAAGETNAEIASKLFISSSTVEYHLRKVFRKLGVTTRHELANATRG
jgi:DNA-binding CsgD family transcriptional regulator